MRVFRPLFGVLALLIATQVFWKIFTTPADSTGKPPNLEGVHAVKIQSGHLLFSHAGHNFNISLWYPVLAGLLIAMIAAIFGVGGGFLLVPFMASLLGMPMHIVPATAAIPIFIGGSVSIANYLQLGATPDYKILALLCIGGMLGACAGPKLNRLCKERWLKLGLGSVVSLIGLKYIVDGLKYFPSSVWY